ncbi:MAG: DsbA family protein [Desulfobacteraceae bacterium]|nr:DsbA family protein [Desulfobacteraceae bacterium]
MKAKHVKPLPYSVYFWAVAVTAAAGLANSIYLAFSHYRVHVDVLYTSFCAISSALNCDTVSQSPYSIFLGLPVAVWGILAYSFFLILLFFAKAPDAGRKRIWPILFVIALGFSIYSLVLAYISKYHIGAYCIMCLAGHAINFALLYFTWLVRRRFPEKGFFSSLIKDLKYLWDLKKKCAYAFSPLVVLAVLLVVFFPSYWRFELPEVSADLATGVTEDGSAWIGAEDPELVITEYTDYMCFHCKKMHAYMRRIVEENPDKIRLVHKHFPMDHGYNPIVNSPYHEGSGKLAVASASALYEGKFWEMNDRLYDIPRGAKTLDVRKLAEQTGVDFNRLVIAPKIKKLRYIVKRDIAEGIKLGITGTPAYVIGGEVYQGRIPVKVIKKAME